MYQAWHSNANTGRALFQLAQLADAAIAFGTYLALTLAFGASIGLDDVMVLVLAAGVLSPARLGFRRFGWNVVFKLMLSWSILLLLLLALGWWAQRTPLSWPASLDVAVLQAWALTTPAVLLAVHALSPRVARRLDALSPARKAVIVGVTELALRLSNLIERGPGKRQRMLGYFDDRQVSRLPNRRAPDVLGELADVAAFANSNGVDAIYICLPMTTQPRILELLDRLRDTTASVYFIPDIFISDLMHARVRDIGGIPAVSICESPLRGISALCKRSLDVVIASAALTLTLPLMIVIAGLVRLSSPGPALFRQKRYGLDGREIVVWKFRTMSLLEDGDKQYHQVTRTDGRVTGLGRFLRRTSLDELPQLVNVLRGSMSIVGPRPHVLAVNELYRRMIPGYMVRHKIKPGITGWAQVNGCRGGDDLESMQRRTEFDLEYLRSWSLSLDLYIMYRTAGLLLLGDPIAY